MPSVVTDQEIQREIDTLRSLRRRSESAGGPNGLIIDPDLPPPTSSSPASSPTYPGRGGSPTSPPKRRERSASNGSLLSPTSPTGGSARSFARSGPELNGGPEAPVAVVGMGDSGGLYDDKDDVEDDGSTRLHVTGGAIAPSPQDDPTHLFWVPAHLHPELAPGEFRAFLKSHTQPDGETDDFDAGQEQVSEAGLAFGQSGLERKLSAINRRSSLSRGSSTGSSTSAGLNRKRSMLSRQYHPRANDNVEDEAPPVPATPAGLGRSSSNRSSIYGGRTGEQSLTLEDLQRLEELADQAAEGGDGDLGKMRSLLRRSLSISTTGSIGEEEGYAGLDENDAPIIIPPRGQILRRTARTKIRKANLPGDGGGHRFGPSRKGRTGLSSPPLGETEEAQDEGRLSPYLNNEHNMRRRGSDRSDESDEMHSAESGFVPGERVGLRDERTSEPPRKLSSASTDESAIYDSYSREGDTSVESSHSSTSVPGEYDDESPPKSYDGHSAEWNEQAQEERTPTDRDYDDGARRRIVGERDKSPEPVFTTPPSSPESMKRQQAQRQKTEQASPQKPQQRQQHQQVNPYEQPQVQHTPSTSPSVGAPQRNERGQSREAVKAEMSLPPPRTSSPAASVPEKSGKEKKGGFFSKKDKESKLKKDKDKKDKDKDGFLGSLFGSKKKHEEPPLKFSSAGPAAAAALLGTSKSAKSIGLAPLGQSSPVSPGFNNYARYPIHVERAVYRLSHIKLANPRRPLYEQVLISNLMFWYLSIINRGHNQPTTPTPASSAVNDEKKAASSHSASEEKPAPPAQPSSTEKENVIVGPPPKSLRSVPSHAGSKGPQPVANGTANANPAQDQPAQQPKRAGLSKPESRGGGPSRTRQAEMPIRQPQYGMQLQMEKEYQRPPQLSAPQQGPPRSATSPPPRTGAPVQQMGPPPQSPGKPRQPSHSSGSTPRDVPPPIMVPAQQQAQQSDRRHAPPRSPHDAYGSQADSMRRSTTERVSLATASLEPHYPTSPNRQGPSPPPQDRRVPPGSPRSGYPQHSGPQPGQVFQYPAGMMNVQPGEVFPPQVGQVFHHPQYKPPPSGGYPLGTPVQINGPLQPGQQPYAGGPPSGSLQPQHRNLPWSDSPGRQLPPGAMAPRQIGPGQEQQWMRSASAGAGGSPRQAPAQLYDDRREGPHHPEYQSRGGPPPRQPIPGQTMPHQGPPTLSPSHRSASASYAHGSPQHAHQQPYNPYARQPEQGQRQPPQVVPGMLYDGRR